MVCFIVDLFQMLIIWWIGLSLLVGFLGVIVVVYCLFELLCCLAVGLFIQV